MPRKFLNFQLPIAIKYQTWYQINAKVEPIYIMIRYANYLIIIFMNINENIRNERKSKNKMGVIYKTTVISAAIYYKLQNLVPNQSLDTYVFSIIW